MGNATRRAVQRQIAAMGVSVFEIGVLMPKAEGPPGFGDARMLLRTWDAETLEKSIPWLRAKNAAGAAIYIRPHGEHPLSMIDDLKAESVERMKAQGFDPVLVVETSPGNQQAWLNHGQSLPKNVSTAAARALAERWGGDKGAADWRHFGRLAGFVNRKPKYQRPDGLFPFVRVVESRPGVVYPQSAAFLQDVRKELHANEAERRQPRTADHVPRQASKTIGDFRADPRYAGDGNRIDLAYAVYALSHGVSESAVRAAIGTRDLSKKGSDARQCDYVQRTIQKADERVQKRIPAIVR